MKRTWLPKGPEVLAVRNASQAKRFSCSIGLNSYVRQERRILMVLIMEVIVLLLYFFDFGGKCSTGQEKRGQALIA
jgi:hypothetical protein